MSHPPKNPAKVLVLRGHTVFFYDKLTLVEEKLHGEKGSGE
jgi:hypothetical protein